MEIKKKKIVIFIIVGIIAILLVAGISFAVAYKLLSEKQESGQKKDVTISKEIVEEDENKIDDSLKENDTISEEAVSSVENQLETEEFEEELTDDGYLDESNGTGQLDKYTIVNPNPDLSQYVKTDITLDVTNTYLTKEMADMIVTDIRFGLTDVVHASNFVGYGRMLQGSNNEEYTYYGGNRNSLIESYYDEAMDTVTPRLDGVSLNEAEVQSFMQQQGVSESVAREALKKQYNIQYYNGLDCAFFNTIRLTAYAPIYSMETPETIINEEIRRLVHDLKKDLLILVRVQMSDTLVQYETNFSSSGYCYANALLALKQSQDANEKLMYNMLRTAIEANDTIKLNVLKMGFSNYQDYEDSLTEY